MFYLKAHAAIFKAYLKIMLTYRGMMLLHMFRVVLMPLVIATAWLSIEKVDSNPYKNSDYLLYYLLVPLVMNLTNSRSVFKFPVSVRDGTLSRELIKPYPPLMSIVIESFSNNLQMLLYLVPFTLICTFLFQSHLDFSFLSFKFFPIFILAVFFGALLRMFISGSIALTGFWLEDVTTLNLLLNGSIWALLGGMIIPVATFPEKIRHIAELLPYRYMLSFPIEIFSGKLTNAAIYKGFSVMLFWTIVFYFTARFIWKRGIKIYSAYGG
ncbi:MAG: ABC-2 family transporter protein [Candidatus Riflebacteria bacterium]|nr:ABC-2 family transporter protein [Candidatus Riflebacteria bacterium]